MEPRVPGEEGACSSSNDFRLLPPPPMGTGPCEGGDGVCGVGGKGGLLQESLPWAGFCEATEGLRGRRAPPGQRALLPRCSDPRSTRASTPASRTAPHCPPGLALSPCRPSPVSHCFPPSIPLPLPAGFGTPRGPSRRQRGSPRHRSSRTSSGRPVSLGKWGGKDGGGGERLVGRRGGRGDSGPPGAGPPSDPGAPRRAALTAAAATTAEPAPGWGGQARGGRAGLPLGPAQRPCRERRGPLPPRRSPAANRALEPARDPGHTQTAGSGRG